MLAMSDLPSKLEWSWDITHSIGDEVQFLIIDFSRGMVLACTEKEGEYTLISRRGIALNFSTP